MTKCDPKSPKKELRNMWMVSMLLLKPLAKSVLLQSNFLYSTELKYTTINEDESVMMGCHGFPNDDR